MIDKALIIAKLNDLVNEKLHQIETLIQDKRNSNTDTKSSMGDKYETSREMLNQEINQLLLQQKNILDQQNQIQKLKPELHSTIEFGSVVYTSFINVIIAASLGEISINDEKFFCISTDTPLAKAISGSTKGDKFTVNNQEHQILEVF